MMKSYKIRLALSAIAVDLVLYWFLFYSGVVLPFINPSQQEYAKQLTSFPRNAMQCYIWMALHFPANLILTLKAFKFTSDRFLPLLTLQTGIIFYLIGVFIDKRKRKQTEVG